MRSKLTKPITIDELLGSSPSGEWAEVLMDHAHDAIFVVGMDGRVLKVNRQAAKLLGWPKDAIKGKPYVDFVHWEDLGIAAAAVDKIFRGEETSDTEVRLVPREGRQVHVEFSGSLVELGGEKVLLGIGRDVTERRENEMEIDRLAAIVASSQDGIFSIGHGGKIETWNAGAERIYGFSAEEILGHSTTKLTPAKSHEEIQHLLRRCWEEREPQEIETEHLHRGQREVRVHASFSPVLSRNGRVIGISVIARDVTARRRDEAALAESTEQLRQAQKMEVVGRLAGGVAHDFNNLLSVIGANTELLAMDLAPDDARREDAKEILKAVERGAALTRQLLAFSHKQPVQPVVLDLDRTVLDLRKMMARMIPENVDLRVSVKGGLPRILADPLQVQQVLMNLVVNSCDAMPKGGSIVVATEPWRRDRFEGLPAVGKEPEEGGVLLSVSDTGTGMEPAVLGHVFEPFFTTKPVGQGTGLGLATIHGIVMGLQGAIWVKSAPGHGTTFHILIPEKGPRDGSPAGPDRAG